MSLVDLFGVNEANTDEDYGIQACCGKSHRNGEAGELLVLADLKIRSFEAAVLNGIYADVISNINGVWRTFQVKSSLATNTFAPGGAWRESGAQRKKVSAYKGKVDAFALVQLSSRLVYYIAIEAVGEGERGFLIKSFSRQACDLSFNELLRRWGAVK